MKSPPVFSVLLLLCLFSISRASPTLTKRAAAPVSTACGDIVNSNNTSGIFPATLVYECMTSVPFNAAVATRWISYLNDSFQFQSNVAYLKNPPASYQQPATDFLGGLNMIQARINSGSYANEYEFEAELQALLYSTHDGHVNMIAGVLSAFSFGASFGLVSLSIDGIDLPKIYRTDHIAASKEPGATWQPSAISKINGVDVVEYLSDFATAQAVGGLEAHADYNQLFSSPAQDIQGVFGIWGGAATFFPGESLTLVLENGTTIGPDPWLAVYYDPGDTGPLETGGDFYNFFVLGFYPASYDPDSDTSDDSSDSNGAAATTTASSAAATPSTWNNPAYPTVPDVAQQDLGTFGGGFISGYFLKESSIAVLSIPSFDEAGDAIDTFSSTIANFVSSATTAGMKKVVIDLQQNYGGDALLAFDTFKQFFPTIEPYGGSRMRAHDSANVMGSTITGYWDSLTEDDEDFYTLIANEWVVTDRINAATGQNFTSWENYYGPYQYNEDYFSSVQRYNLSDFLFDTMSLQDLNGFAVYGAGYNPATTPQPWAAEDIIILSDALCSSTCSLFMEMMHHEAGVRTVVAGGLPNYGPMQAPGLTRGARAYGVTDNLDDNIAFAQYILEDANQPSDFLPNRTNALDVVISYAQFNLRDQVRKGETTPLQFAYEAANCRIFYTPDTWDNYTALWQYAADAIWSKPTLCVKGSTGYASTNASDVAGPPSSVLVTSKAKTTPAAMGKISMTMFSGGSAASPDDNGIEDQQLSHSSSSKNLLGKNCADPDTGLPLQSVCGKKYYCNDKYSTCVNGKSQTFPACVKRCVPSASIDVCSNIHCRPIETASGVISVSKGYCPSPNNYCTNAKNQNKVGPGEGGGPSSEKRGSMEEADSLI